MKHQLEEGVRAERAIASLNKYLYIYIYTYLAITISLQIIVDLLPTHGDTCKPQELKLNYTT